MAHRSAGRVALVLGLIAASLFAAAGCGNSDGSEATAGDQAVQRQADLQAARQQAARQRARAAHRRAAHRARVAARQQRRAEARLLLRDEREAEEREAEEEAVPEESECDSNYAGACLSPTAYDYDCADGSGDGPEYTGTVTVVGEDHYGLDADGDGTGCELG